MPYGIENHIVVCDEYITDYQAGAYFKTADFFIAPYTAGTQSGALKMAMAYRLPCVVSSRISHVESTVPDGIVTFETGNSIKLAQSICDILFLRSVEPQNDNLASSESQDGFIREILIMDIIQKEKI